MSFSHVAYADESNYSKGPYPSIALVSLLYEHAGQASQDVAAILAENDIDEFKWIRLHSAKRRFAALRLLDYVIDQAAGGVLRVDVLTWDLSDGRHRVSKLDKIANMQRMYYHLFRNVLRARWPADAVWRLQPDEQTAMNWHEVQDYLDLGSLVVEEEQGSGQPLMLTVRLKKEFHIQEIIPCHSESEPLVQLADFFAGLASYSRAGYGRYEAWQQGHKSSSRSDPAGLSHSDRERCLVLDELDKRCKRRRLGVSLRTHRGLRTMNPRNPLNFWWYIPQHTADKAPTR
ncbi:MAG: DUF3800 domain-containing protein [Chloroflexi bacterium]|nr:DUF3800 domain-containing protein [Chloroflexota bacterium]MCI0579770.1 DUF3800 domain-containing protein [Chloroflexota bacterium]MCI0649142.1 DUF3800 domain-containing protein [Chloroflexota bacterium]MCI0731248.1 DUF3800 domain-containing protein [Chloroflexota bacterium]